VKLKIAHLYPDLLELYSDRGNVIILQKRAQWRGMDVTVDSVTVGDGKRLQDYDLLMMGGGMDREQDILAHDLQHRKGEFEESVTQGSVFLGICAGFQFLGNSFVTHAGREIPCLGLLDMHTVGVTDRKVGNFVLEMDIDGKPTHLFGYENRSGRTYLGPTAEPLARVVKGSGNNGQDRFEGVKKGTIYGTYMHGPLLAKNPVLADHLIEVALRRRDASIVLEDLDNELENRARAKLLKRFLKAR
jgi:lipid II isoglutaminyl synthase (glutamine-hydrolysing)